jgi:butyryl-CoA dehydrogenase
VLDRGRIETAALSLGIADAALEAAKIWARERQVSGQAVADFQGIRWMIADMATELDAARLMTWRAAALRQRGARFTREAAMAKLYASEAVGRIADLALQIHGGYGYTRALPLERYVRDARILRIYEGTSEIQRNIIARAELDQA